MKPVLPRRVFQKLLPASSYVWLSRRKEELLFAIMDEIRDSLEIAQYAEYLQKRELLGRLDYDAATISMTISAPGQMRRLNACRKEPETVAWIQKYLSRRSTLYDIGANVGAYSFVANAISKGESMVYAIEPSRSTFAALCRNIRINKCQKNVIPFQVALSNSVGVQELVLSDMSPGAASHTLRPLDADGAEGNDLGESEPVLSLTIDSMIEQFKLAMPNMVKIDVDGAEENVINGGRETFWSPEVKSVLVEVYFDKPSAERIFETMGKMGFVEESRWAHGGTSIANVIFTRP
ncbi:MAG: FkbM family methyltransferase [Deltaproteobacteria bacterium]|nr:FkbM family methyltransferase [Deltaproteobacteria bacterium]